MKTKNLKNHPHCFINFLQDFLFLFLRISFSSWMNSNKKFRRKCLGNCVNEAGVWRKRRDQTLAVISDMQYFFFFESFSEKFSLPFTCHNNHGAERRYCFGCFAIEAWIKEGSSHPRISIVVSRATFDSSTKRKSDSPTHPTPRPVPPFRF